MRRVTLSIMMAITAICGMTACAAQPAVRETAQSESPSAAAEEQDSRQDATMKAFVEAAWQSRMDEAAQYVSPGSVAERYVVHQQAVQTAYNANGEGGFATEDQPTLSFADGIVTVAEAHESATYTLSEFTFDDDGLVSAWTGKSGPVGEALWSQSWSGAAGDSAVDLVSAYKANSGALLVVLKITANGAAVSPYGYGATYAASDGITYSVASASQPDTITAGSAGYVVLVFDGAPFGGSVTLEATNPEDYSTSWSATIPVS